MSKVTGQSINFGKAQQLRTHAVGFENNSTIRTAIGSVDASTQTFFNNLDCAFVFDKFSLQSLIAIINHIPDSGLIMRLGASINDQATDPTRIDKPTLSIFPCTIDTTNDLYQVIHPDPTKPNDTLGVEHPGIVDLNSEVIPGAGRIQFLNE